MRPAGTRPGQEEGSGPKEKKLLCPVRKLELGSLDPLWPLFCVFGASVVVAGRRNLLEVSCQ